jgi:hypothetical protein
MNRFLVAVRIEDNSCAELAFFPMSVETPQEIADLLIAESEISTVKVERGSGNASLSRASLSRCQHPWYMLLNGLFSRPGKLPAGADWFYLSWRLE